MKKETKQVIERVKKEIKQIMGRVKKQIKKRLDHLMGLDLNNQNLMKAINCRVTPIAGYVRNVI